MSIVIDGEKIKKAAHRANFRNMFPELREQFDAWIRKPGCDGCWRDVLNGIVQYNDRLVEYFGGQGVEIRIEMPEDRPQAQTESGFRVIADVSIHELEDALNRLPQGPKQVTAARYEDRITVIVNLL